MRQLHKMVKHTQTIHRQQPMNCLRVFDHFVGLALKGLRYSILEFQNLTFHDAIQCRSMKRGKDFTE